MGFMKRKKHPDRFRPGWCEGKCETQNVAASPSEPVEVKSATKKKSSKKKAARK